MELAGYSLALLPSASRSLVFVVVVLYSLLLNLTRRWSVKEDGGGQLWQHTLVISGTGSYRQEGQEFKVSLCYIERLSLAQVT